jgi:hypothetical protein
LQECLTSFCLQSNSRKFLSSFLSPFAKAGGGNSCGNGANELSLEYFAIFPDFYPRCEAEFDIDCICAICDQCNRHALVPTSSSSSGRQVRATLVASPAPLLGSSGPTFLYINLRDTFAAVAPRNVVCSRDFDAGGWAGVCSSQLRQGT